MGFIYFAPTGQGLHCDVIGYRYISPMGFFERSIILQSENKISFIKSTTGFNNDAFRHHILVIEDNYKCLYPFRDKI